MAKSKQGMENLYASLGGGIAAVIADVAWNSIRLPGYKTPSALDFITQGDVIQMGAAGMLATAGFSQGCSRMAPFGFGALFAQVLTKIVFPAFDMPRYIFFDLERSGKIAPIGQFPR